MSDKIIKLNPGEELDIFIKRRKENPSSLVSKAKRRGVIEPFRFNDVLPRRLQKKGIRFWDLGQFVLGSGWQTLGEYLETDVTFELRDNFPSFPYPSDEAMTMIYQNLFSEFTEVDFIDYKDLFYEIKKGDADFEKAITVVFDREPGDTIFGDLTTLPEWTDKGLKLTAAQLLTLKIASGGVFFNLGYLDFEAVKVTSVYDFEADAVEFTPGGDMDIFITPTFTFNFGRTDYWNGLHAHGSYSDYIEKVDYFQPTIQVFPRSLIADYWEMAEATGYDRIYKTWQIIKQLPVAAGFRTTYDFAETSNHPYSATYESIPLEDCPNPALYTPTGINNTATLFDNTNVLKDASIGTWGDLTITRLKAIIKKGEDWFYVWQT